ncbi:MAG: S24 family peptidase [Gammaproteobacteria bacterium]|nr:S24 family peptidase [Gammaproteobacteria bacterium]
MTMPAADTAESLSCEKREPYVLMALGDSMEPEFCDGDVVVIEPDYPPRSGHFVIAMHNGEYTFRQLLQRGDAWYLHPLNSRYPDAEVSGPDCVKGVISQKKRPGRRKKGEPRPSYL